MVALRSQPAPGVVVTGLGLATSLGFGVRANWEALLAGRSSIRLRPPEEFLTPIPMPPVAGAAVAPEELAARIQAAVPRGVWNTCGETCHLWLLSALEALEQAGLHDPGGSGGVRPAVAPERVGVFVGSGGGSSRFIEREFVNFYTAPEARKRDVSRMAVAKYMTSSFAAQLSLLKGFRGPSLTVNTACASGATALVQALDALRAGRADCVVAGGVDITVVGSTLKGFHKLGALTAHPEREAGACRPFHEERDGIVLGDGAACLVLEREDAAAARGAGSLAALLGGAHASEAHSLLSPAEEGAEMARAIALALADARKNGTEPEDTAAECSELAGRVAHVYAHGTGTRYNDQCEAAALGRELPHGPTVSATKAQLGHTLGAAGAVDAVLAVRSLQEGQVVPQFHLAETAPGCAITPARAARHPLLREAPDAVVLVNAFAFGGHNACLLFGKG